MLQIFRNITVLDPSSDTTNTHNDKTEADVPTPIKMSNKTEVSLLNEYVQKHNKTPPTYDYSERTIKNRKEYTAKCTFEGQVSCGTASSKNEAKRLAAAEMLVGLRIEVNVTCKPVQKEPVISNKLEEFDRTKLDIHLDQFLENREKDYSKFRKQFVGDVPENTDEQYEFSNETTTSLKSKTLDRLKSTGTAVVNMNNSCRVFKEIVQEMRLNYFAEFQETANNDKYVVIIKLNTNIFTVSGSGDTPEEAIKNSCKTAVEYLHIFNM